MSNNFFVLIFLDLELVCGHSQLLEKRVDEENINYLAVTTEENDINFQESSNRRIENNEIESMEDDRNNNDHDENGNKQMEINATEEMEENETDGIILNNRINTIEQNENEDEENENEIGGPEEIGR